MSCSSATRHAGDSVRRCVTRTSFTFSPSAFLMRSMRSLYSPASFSCSFFSVLVRELAEIEPALGDRLQRLAFELGQEATRPTRRRGRRAAALRCPSCGRSRGAGCSSRRRSVSAVDVVDLVLPFLHARRRSPRATRPAPRCPCASRRSAASFAMRSRLAWSSPEALLEDAPELLPERRVLLLLVLREVLEQRQHAPDRPGADHLDVACDSCRISRETLSGRSFESMTPRTKRRYAGIRCSASSMMNTRRT